MKINNSYKGKPYTGSVTIEWQKGTRLVGSTDRLRYRSVEMGDGSDYYALFSNEKVVEFYGNQKTKTLADVTKYLTTQTNRRKSGDPFHAFHVETKKGEFLGHIVCGHGYWKGEAHIAYALLKRKWDNGYGKEMASFLRELGASLRGRKVNGKFCDRISCTVHKDNKWSKKCLDHLGFKEIKKKNLPKNYKGKKPYYSLKANLL